MGGTRRGFHSLARVGPKADLGRMAKVGNGTQHVANVCERGASVGLPIAAEMPAQTTEVDVTEIGQQIAFPCFGGGDRRQTEQIERCGSGNHQRECGGRCWTSLAAARYVRPSY